MPSVPLSETAAHWPVIVNLLAGSLLGAWAGAEWATRLKSETLYRIIAVLLVVIAGVPLFAHYAIAGCVPSPAADVVIDDLADLPRLIEMGA